MNIQPLLRYGACNSQGAGQRTAGFRICADSLILALKSHTALTARLCFLPKETIQDIEDESLFGLATQRKTPECAVGGKYCVRPLSRETQH